MFNVNASVLISGKLGLARTFWGYGFLGQFIWLMIFLLTQAVDKSGLLTMLTFLAFSAYYIMVYIGIWNSAGIYKGNPIYSTLARFIVVMSSLSVLMAIVIAIKT